MNQQDALASKLSPMEAILVPDGPRTGDQIELLRACGRIESQLARLEGQVYKFETQFHRHTLQDVRNHVELLKVARDIMARLGDLETRLGLRKPSDPQQRL